MEEA
ncbi:Protein of unknown function [Bacillus cereus]|jgi:hypothetical protein